MGEGPPSGSAASTLAVQARSVSLSSLEYRSARSRIEVGGGWRRAATNGFTVLSPGEAAPGDSVAAHIADTLGAGAGLNDPEAVQKVKLSDTDRDDEFWTRYRNFGETAKGLCAG